MINKCGGVGIKAGVAARLATGECTAVLISCSQVSEITSDLAYRMYRGRKIAAVSDHPAGGEIFVR